MTLPADYLERVYAGVLGKIIGVYLGRPIEGWTYEKISAELGEADYYVHEKWGKKLIVTDDDITGTFTFIRSLEDAGCPRDLTPAQIGRAWLNYIIENKTILWWGGLGNSTEHTAYLRLKSGIKAPRSGSIDLNSKVVAEQIGAQIFIDGWAMVAPGDPELAADLARRAGSVSHDGEAIYAAQVIAAMESLAFVESDLGELLDTASALIPADSVIYQMIAELRNWRVRESDWRRARELLASDYGYDRYGGGCHVVPNHGLIILGLLWGDDDFGKSLMITNTCGWDTDCNSGNVGCILGIKNGLAAIDAKPGTPSPDWRGPIADRLYLPTADGGRCITDAATEAVRLANMGRRLAGEDEIRPKGGARFHFDLPGSVHGFTIAADSPAAAAAMLHNVAGHTESGRRSLAIEFPALSAGQSVRAATPTFITPGDLDMRGYALLASPTLYSGQTLTAEVEADVANSGPVTCRLSLREYLYGTNHLIPVPGPPEVLEPGQRVRLRWKVPPANVPIADVGIEITPASGAAMAGGRIFLDYLTWHGTPDVTLPCKQLMPSGIEQPAVLAQRAWVDAVSSFGPEAGALDWRLIQNQGRGLVMQGTREWRDYRVSATVEPHMVQAAGIAACVQGMTRYYALLLVRNHGLRLIRMRDRQTVLAQQSFDWNFGQLYDLAMQIQGDHLTAWLDGKLLFDVRDTKAPLEGGAVAMVCEEGRCAFGPVSVAPAR